ncbi:hypothetical protein [Halomonas dongshanensis]|uniref:Uncharacterized protein n=1 Tax=Halomonas dongshanensis TaxID=2890835 RepID=A0ABT2EH12_9GAMM|nr:hypothetical protein [Halomonas dongshanensis]MCS2610887.1 hypothetical protein [Halomonas dongshanensis]
MRYISFAQAAAILTALSITSAAYANDTEQAGNGASETPVIQGEAAAGGDAVAAPLVVDIPGESGATVTIEVTSMEIVGELLRIGVTFTPEWQIEPFSGRSPDLAQVLGANLSNPINARLIDPANLLEYQLVTRGSSRVIPMTEGVPRTVYFYFGTPVEEMESFDLYLEAERVALPPLTDVPYQVE